jgi:hypothetical protein
MTTINDVMATIARQTIERVETLGIKGDKRQADAALHYWCGAASGLLSAVSLMRAGPDRDRVLAAYNHIAMEASMVISVRGMFGIREIAAQADEKQTA